mmetsp:Transcript_31188/g.48824  ORF Transcript_31188/g.48824 Transcript_31188/m.48824 type:complete len:300 (+) Transcript_31188:403-1302(+)
MKKQETGERYYPKASYSMLHYLIHTCNFDKLREVCQDLESIIHRELAEGEETGITPIEALVLIGTYTDHKLLMQATHNFALRSMSRILEARQTRLTSYTPKPKGRRLKLGYISGGLRHHPDGRNLQGVFSRHNRNQVEVYCFSLKRDEGTAVQQRLQRDCEHYVDYTDLDHYDVAKAVNSLGVNVLLDVNGYTGEGVRMQRNIILALTPARIQVFCFLPARHDCRSCTLCLSSVPSAPRSFSPSALSDLPFQPPKLSAHLPLAPCPFSSLRSPSQPEVRCGGSALPTLRVFQEAEHLNI